MSFRKHAGVAALAGAVAALGHAPFGLWWAALPAFALLIWIVAAAPQRPGWLAWVGAAGYFGLSMHWIVEPFLVDAATHGWMAPIALILLAGGLAIFWALAAKLAARLGKDRGTRALALAALLTGAELLRGHIFTGFPWALPAYIWADTPLLGVVSLTGSYGLVFLTLLIAALPALFRTAWPGFALAVVGVAGLYFAGQAQLSQASADQQVLGKVRIVQPNVPQSEKWQRDKVPDHLERMMSLTGADPEAGQGADLVVWPEAAVVYPLGQAGGILAQAARIATEAHGTATEVILGINRRDAEDRWFNSLVTVAPNGIVQDMFDKVHLVPFGEYIPFRIEFLRAMAASSGFGFTPGDTVRLIDTPLGRALPLICYEGIFPRHLFRAGARADYILLITNDAWFGTFSGPYQHFDQARFRAVEHRLPVVRAANTGVSAVIGPDGQVAGSLPLGEAGHLDAAVSSGGEPSFYSRTGDWPVLVILLLTLTALFLLKKRNTIANTAQSS